ncbi:MAG: glycosyltransferase [Gaiellaceae bacterium]
MSAVRARQLEAAPTLDALYEAKRVLVWSPNYAPELTGIAPLVTDACEWLAARGHAVDVVTALPNYPQREILDGYRGRFWSDERSGRVGVHRSWLRVQPQETFADKVLYELTFASCALPRVARRLRSSDVLVCVVPSLFAAGAAAIAARATGARLVLWIQDLVLSGALSLDNVGPVRRRLLGAAGAIESLAARAADRVVVCSPGFVDHFVARGAVRDRVSVLPNWVDVDRIVATPPPARQTTRFLYSGNLGYSQGFETLVQASELAGEGVEVEINGEGNAGAHVRALSATSTRTTVQAPVPRDDYPQLLSSADVHVVLQRAVIGGANLPSKIASSLASGRPIVASIGLATPAAELLRASGGALLVEPDSPEALAAAMRRLHESPVLRQKLGRNGRRYAVEHLSRDAVLARFERELLP